MFRIDYLPTKASKGRCALLISLLIFIYIIENSSIRIMIGASIFNYIVKPFLWLGAVWIVWLFPAVRPKAGLKHLSSIKGWAFVFAFIFIAVSFLTGIFVDGLGESPYSHSATGILLNILVVGSALLGRELVRNYLVNNIAKEENYVVFIIIALFMTFTSTSFSSIISLKGTEDLVKFIAQYVAPDFSNNLLATYLAYLGGPLPAIIYIGIIQGVHWLSPVLPNLRWITAALVGVMVPVFSLTAMQNIYLKEAKQLKAKDKDDESVLSWIITSLLSIGIIWFTVGVFPIYPSVIATGSMEPMIKPGDVILVKKITDMEGINGLKVGDVMQFRRGSILITHRIIEIKEKEKEGIRFRTKGDNNSGPDTELVKPEDVKGTVVYVIPKIGWPTLLIKSKDDVPLDEIVF
ncbi:MAG: signal peptidase I [Clostridiales bacterium GWB2_37_7]|nr:MAG: signal peptidase I [Clostridiales bacterium GWB2_37_7]